MATRPSPRLKEPITQQFQLGPWTVTSSKSHILESEGPEREKFEGELELPQVPEMIFAGNKLRLEHQGGFGLEFNSLDALKRVEAHEDPFRVAAAEEWQKARADCEHIQNIVKPFDWTFSTDYKGTLVTKGDHPGITAEETTERIDIEKLKVREKILFYDDILLFEDELSDNGSSILNVKIRVMPSSFFILMRFFMRVDNVIIRVNDTRIYHEADKNYILREFTSKDDYVKSLKVDPHLFTDPNEINNHLTLRKETFEKLVLPSVKSPENSKCAGDAAT